MTFCHLFLLIFVLVQHLSHNHQGSVLHLDLTASDAAQLIRHVLSSFHGLPLSAALLSRATTRQWGSTSTSPLAWLAHCIHASDQDHDPRMHASSRGEQGYPTGSPSSCWCDGLGDSHSPTWPCWSVAMQTGSLVGTFDAKTLGLHWFATLGFSFTIWPCGQHLHGLGGLVWRRWSQLEADTLRAADVSWSKVWHRLTMSWPEGHRCHHPAQLCECLGSMPMWLSLERLPPTHLGKRGVARVLRDFKALRGTSIPASSWSSSSSWTTCLCDFCPWSTSLFGVARICGLAAPGHLDLRPSQAESCQDTGRWTTSFSDSLSLSLLPRTVGSIWGILWSWQLSTTISCPWTQRIRHAPTACSCSSPSPTTTWAERISLDWNESCAAWGNQQQLELATFLQTLVRTMVQLQCQEGPVDRLQHQCSLVIVLKLRDQTSCWAGATGTFILEILVDLQLPSVCKVITLQGTILHSDHRLWHPLVLQVLDQAPWTLAVGFFRCANGVIPDARDGLHDGHIWQGIQHLLAHSQHAAGDVLAIHPALAEALKHNWISPAHGFQLRADYQASSGHIVCIFGSSRWPQIFGTKRNPVETTQAVKPCRIGPPLLPRPMRSPLCFAYQRHFADVPGNVPHGRC